MKNSADEKSVNLTTVQTGVIITAFAILSVVSNGLFPIFEGPDEHSHYHYSRLLAQGKGLPIQTEPDRSADAEGFNPPLYYLAPAAILRAMDPDVGAKVAHIGIVTNEELQAMAAEGVTLPTLNPDVFTPGDPRIFLHPRAGAFSARMLNTIHAMRLISTLCGIITLMGVSMIARLAFPARPEIQRLMLCLVAFQPQFIFISSVLNSDNMVTAFATLVIWRLVKLLGADQSTFKDALILGVLMGLGALSKPNMLFLFAPIAVVFFMRAGGVARCATQLSLIIALAALIAGWFFLRNASLYGPLDFFGWNKRAELHPIFVLPVEHRWEFLTSKFLGNLFTSFWGRFSWLSISLPIWMYIVYGIISVMGVASVSDLFKGKGDSRLRSILWLCLCIVTLNISSLIAFNFRFAAYQGRLIFPSLAAIAVLIVNGWVSIHSAAPASTLKRRSWMLCAFLIAMAVLVQCVLIYPIYFAAPE